ncbi:MAG: response regulator, partial [Spirochaetia bacterium]|nr:response regulator [Spirochaetia bacterium]
MSDRPDFPKDVLIVDDSINNLNLLESILKSVPYRVRMALNAEIAIRSIKAKLPDIILLDIHLPGLDGFSLCRQLKSSEPTKGIPIIFITASDNPEELQEAFACGAADFIRKPFNKDEIAARISTHLSLSMVTNELKAKNIALVEEMQKKTKTHLLLSSDQEALKSFIAESQNALDDCCGSSFAYHRFCDLMRELTGASYAVFNLFEESGDFFNTIAISGIAGLG